MKKWMIPLVVIALVASGVYIAAGRGSGAASAADTAQFSAMPADRGDIQETILATGQLAPAENRVVVSEVEGTVKAVHVAEGDRVEEGQLLIELENNDLALQVRDAEINVELARQKLADTLGVDASAALNAGVAEEFTVSTPTEGRITQILVGEGQNLAAGTPVARLVNDDELLFVMKVSGSEVAGIQVGQEASVLTDGFAVQALPGEVVAVDRKGKAEEGFVLHDVEIRVANPGALQPGMTGQAEVETPAGKVVREGTYEAAEEEVIEADRAGTVQEILVKAGDWVEANDPILTGSTADLALTVETQRLQVEQAELTLESRRESLEKLRITAPIDGVVENLQVAVGDVVRITGSGSPTATSQDGLLTISATNRMEVVVPVDELDIVQIREGQTASVTVDALPGRVFTGEVTAIASTGTSQNGVANFDVTVEFEATPELRPGMTARVNILLAERKDVLRVPSEAVTVMAGSAAAGNPNAGGVGANGANAGGREGAGQGNRAVVRVIENGEPVARPVQIGLRTERWTEILSGLEEGEMVVVATGDSSTSGSSGFGGGFGGGFMGTPTRLPGATVPHPGGGARP